MKWLKLPSKSTIIGLLFELNVLKTRTALPVDDVVVAGTVVTSGAGVVPVHSKSLQGQPAEQLSLI